MKETVISWTAPNFLTIGLMLLLFSAALGAVAKAVAKRRSEKEG